MVGVGDASDTMAIRELYEQILIAWNRRDAAAMAAGFREDGNLIGFDGSQVDSSQAIEAHLQPIFASHPTPAYVAKVREIHLLRSDVGILRAVAGMVAPGSSEINPALNTVQTLVALRTGDKWRAALFQSTPAAWHGRPQDSVALTEEVYNVLRSGLTCR